MRFRTVLTMIAVAACLGGCGEDRIIKPAVRRSFPRLYPTLSDPAKVIDALRTAYPLGDSNEIKLIYDRDYQGTSLDQNDRGPTIKYFMRQDEIQHVSYLAHHPELRVTMVIQPVLTRFSDLNDPPGWAVVRNPLNSLSVTDTLGKGYVVDFVNDTMEFHFIPHAPDSTSPTDTTWRIVRWIEFRQTVP